MYVRRDHGLTSTNSARHYTTRVSGRGFVGRYTHVFQVTCKLKIFSDHLSSPPTQRYTPHLHLLLRKNRGLILKTLLGQFPLLS